MQATKRSKADKNGKHMACTGSILLQIDGQTSIYGQMCCRYIIKVKCVADVWPNVLQNIWSDLLQIAIWSVCKEQEMEFSTAMKSTE